MKNVFYRSSLCALGISKKSESEVSLEMYTACSSACKAKLVSVFGKNKISLPHSIRTLDFAITVLYLYNHSTTVYMDTKND